MNAKHQAARLVRTTLYLTGLVYIGGGIAAFLGIAVAVAVPGATMLLPGGLYGGLLLSGEIFSSTAAIQLCMTLVLACVLSGLGVVAFAAAQGYQKSGAWGRRRFQMLVLVVNLLIFLLAVVAAMFIVAPSYGGPAFP